MNRYPAKVAATLQQRLVDKAHPLVISIDRERRVREIQGDAARYGYPDNQVEPLLQLCADMLVGADAAQPGYWPLVHLAQGHHVALHWIPDDPFDHVIITDSDLCNAELAERQQAANELALAGIEKSRTIRELKRVRLELEAREQALKDTQAFQRRLIDTLAHDLRTPLTSISGYAALMGGKLDLQSAVGVGTRIEIRLPEEPPAASAEGAPAAPGEPPLALRNRRVLIVDDDPDICELLLWSLREIGYQPEILHDAGKVQARVDAVDPGLIVIDVDLGLRSGLVVTQELRLHGYRGAIVVFSGAADPRTRRAAERAGADAFLPKPLDLTGFHDWMKRVLPAA